LSLNSSSECSSDHSPLKDDRDFFDRLLFLSPGSETKESSAAEEQAVNNAVNGAAGIDPEDGITYNRTQPSEGLLSSSKPTILPINALRLHLDDPSIHHTVEPPSEPVNNDFRRVRFRSRVRITSGFSHHRRKSDVGSSRSDSPSSSISVPLRSHSRDNTNAWGTLGQRVGLLAVQKMILGSQTGQRRQQGLTVRNEHVDECTPLRNSFNNLAYVEGERIQGDVFDDEPDDERLSQEADNVFGEFPGRLLNYHWWYWQLEPIMCCHYAADLE